MHVYLQEDRCFQFFLSLCLSDRDRKVQSPVYNCLPTLCPLLRIANVKIKEKIRLE